MFSQSFKDLPRQSCNKTVWGSGSKPVKLSWSHPAVQCSIPGPAGRCFGMQDNNKDDDTMYIKRVGTQTGWGAHC